MQVKHPTWNLTVLSTVPSVPASSLTVTHGWSTTCKVSVRSHYFCAVRFMAFEREVTRLCPWVMFFGCFKMSSWLCWTFYGRTGLPCNVSLLQCSFWGMLLQRLALLKELLLFVWHHKPHSLFNPYPLTAWLLPDNTKTFVSDVICATVADPFHGNLEGICQK